MCISAELRLAAPLNFSLRLKTAKAPHNCFFHWIARRQCEVNLSSSIQEIPPTNWINFTSLTPSKYPLLPPQSAADAGGIFERPKKTPKIKHSKIKQTILTKKNWIQRPPRSYHPSDEMSQVHPIRLSFIELTQNIHLKVPSLPLRQRPHGLPQIQKPRHRVMIPSQMFPRSPTVP